MFSTILFPLDQSLETGHAVGLVADLATKYNSSVIVLSVIDPEEIKEEAITQVKQQRQKLLQQATSVFQEAGLNAVRSLEVEGNVPFAICDVADDEGAELIVMGCRGVGLAADEDISHSVSVRVMQLAPCPVLMVP